MRPTISLAWPLLAFVLPVSAQTTLPPTTAEKVDYEKQVKPLLAENCYSCHGEDKQQSGLRLDLRQNALRGGDYGPVIIPGKSADSKLIRKLVDGDGGKLMPPTGELAPSDISMLRAWIDQGADFRNEVVDEKPPKAIEPKLAQAIKVARQGQCSTLEQLVKENPDLAKAKDLGGATLLHHAAGFGTVDSMKVLLVGGADVNATNRLGSPPLFWAIQDEDKVRLLLSRGARVNLQNIAGRNALYLAAGLGEAHAILTLLLKHGADPNLALANGRSPLMAAAERGDTKAVRILLSANAAIDACNGAGETALMMAASNGSAETVRLLLDHGADPRVLTKRNESALGYAGTAGNEKVVRALLDRGAPVNARNLRGYSPLMLAASSDVRPTAAVKLLLARGADKTFTADYSENACDLAQKRGDTEIVRLLGTGPRKSAPTGILTEAKSNRALSIPDAVDRALTMTEKQSYNFIRIAGCNSCHSQDLPSAAAAFARGRGLNAPREIPQLPQSMMPSAGRIMDFEIVSVPSKAWELFDFGMNGVPKDEYTDAIVRVIKSLQAPQGNWPLNESRRPPMNAGEFQATALAIYSLTHYWPEGDEVSCQQAVVRAVKWLEKSKPQNTQDRAFHALGLAWGDPGSETAKRAGHALAALQRSDGGWSQLPGLDSDAYATGQVLFALFTCGSVAVNDPVYQKGVRYLLNTQAADGTWHVKTRSIWLQPYFESGFPYGRDQFISTAGTAWAAMALAAAQPGNLAQR